MPIVPDENNVLRPWPKHPYGDPMPCGFCPAVLTNMYNFQGTPICAECNRKLVERESQADPAISMKTKQGPPGPPGPSGPMGPPGDNTRPYVSYRACDFCNTERMCTLWVRYHLCDQCEVKMMSRIRVILNFQ